MNYSFVVVQPYVTAPKCCPHGAQTHCLLQNLFGGRHSGKVNEHYGSAILLSWTGKKLASCEVLQSQNMSSRRQLAPAHRKR